MSEVATIKITMEEYVQLENIRQRELKVRDTLKRFMKTDRTGDWLAVKLLIIYQDGEHNIGD